MMVLIWAIAAPAPASDAPGGRWDPTLAAVSYASLEGEMADVPIEQVCPHDLYVQRVGPSPWPTSSDDEGYSRVTDDQLAWREKRDRELAEHVANGLVAFHDGWAAASSWRWPPRAGEVGTDLVGSSSVVAEYPADAFGGAAQLVDLQWDRAGAAERIASGECDALVGASVRAYDFGQVEVIAVLRTAGGLLTVELTVHRDGELDGFAPLLREIGGVVGRHLTEAHAAARGKSTEGRLALRSKPSDSQPLPELGEMRRVGVWAVVPEVLSAHPRPLVDTDWRGDHLVAADSRALRVWDEAGVVVATHRVRRPSAVGVSAPWVAVCDKDGARLFPLGGGDPERLGACDAMVVYGGQIVVAREGQLIARDAESLEPVWTLRLPNLRWLVPAGRWIVVGADDGVRWVAMDDGDVDRQLDTPLPASAVLPLDRDGSFGIVERVGGVEVLDVRLVREPRSADEEPGWDYGPRYLLPADLGELVRVGGDCLVIGEGGFAHLALER